VRADIFHGADALEDSAGSRGDRIEISWNAWRPTLSAVFARTAGFTDQLEDHEMLTI